MGDEVAEGVYTAPAAKALCEKHGVRAPIVNAVNDILSGTLAPAQSIHNLMTRPVRNELIFDPALFPHEPHVYSSVPQDTAPYSQEEGKEEGPSRSMEDKLFS